MAGAVIGPGDGERFTFLGTDVTIKLDGEATGGRFAIFEDVLPHGAAPPLHSHPEDETFYVLDGEMSVWLGDEEHRLVPGSVMLAPGGTPHTFLVRSESARVIVLSTPAGIEAFARASGDERDPERRAQIERDFGMTRHGPPPRP